MASDLNFVEYVAEQLSDAGEIAYRKMFGEYGLYCDGKYFASVEDNRLCLKITEAGGKLLPDATVISPHEGSYAFYIADLSDRAFLTELVRTTCAALPAKKPRKK